MEMAFIGGSISMAGSMADAVLAGWQGKIPFHWVYPRVSLSDARKKRDELRKQLEANLDPSAERKATNLRKKLSVENSLEAIALEMVRQTTAHLGSASC
jgi:hypothetical protein